MQHVAFDSDPESNAIFAILAVIADDAELPENRTERVLARLRAVVTYQTAYGVLDLHAIEAHLALGRGDLGTALLEVSAALANELARSDTSLPACALEYALRDLNALASA